jgi:hypothetical protein
LPGGELKTRAAGYAKVRRRRFNRIFSWRETGNREMPLSIGSCSFHSVRGFASDGYGRVLNGIALWVCNRSRYRSERFLLRSRRDSSSYKTDDQYACGENATPKTKLRLPQLLLQKNANKLDSFVNLTAAYESSVTLRERCEGERP